MLSYTKRAMKITDIFYGQHNKNDGPYHSG